MNDALNKKIELEVTTSSDKEAEAMVEPKTVQPEARTAEIAREKKRLSFKFKPRLSRKALFPIIGISVFLFVFLIVFLALPLWRLKADFSPLMANAQKTAAAAQTQDLNQAVTGIQVLSLSGGGSF